MLRLLYLIVWPTWKKAGPQTHHTGTHDHNTRVPSGHHSDFRRQPQGEKSVPCDPGQHGHGSLLRPPVCRTASQ